MMIAGPAPPWNRLSSTRRPAWLSDRQGAGLVSGAAAGAVAKRSPEIEPPAPVAVTQGPADGAISGGVSGSPAPDGADAHDQVLVIGPGADPDGRAVAGATMASAIVKVSPPPLGSTTQSVLR